ncbi:MAG: hypothetical protein HOP16_20435 [Acidobacteria bacterium]|nr:hypothetical protein [Acidobacteriota bacterium]
MSALDYRIDELYQGPLESFTASRNALAKTLPGDAKKQVMALAKPLAIPWLINQTYWHARETYDELMSAGKKLRTAQLGGLQGRSTDVRAASEQHEQALAAAMKAALKLAPAGGVQSQTDLLRRMFEAVSTRAALPVEHGRFVKVIEPAGFEALSGLSIAAPLRAVERAADKPATSKEPRRSARTPSAAELKALKRKEQREERERAETERRHKLAIAKAKEKVTAATQAENRARFEWERAKKNVEAAERALSELLSSED